MLLPLPARRVLDPLGEEDLPLVVVDLELGADIALQVRLVTEEILCPLFDPLRRAGVDVDAIDVAVGLDPVVFDQDVLGIQRQGRDDRGVSELVVKRVGL